MARRAEAFSSPRNLILLLAVIVAAVVWITASKSGRASSEAVGAKPTEDVVVTPSQAAAVTQEPTPTPTVVARASEPSAPEAESSEGQDEALAWEAIDVPLTLPTFESGPDAFPAMVGIRAVRDPVTGKLTVPSEEERRRMAEQMKGLWTPSDDTPLVSQTFPNGGQIVTLDERYTEFVVIERGPDGKLRTRCVSGSQPPVAGTAGAAPGDR